MNLLRRLYITSVALALLIGIYSGHALAVGVDCVLHFERSSDPLKTECWSSLNEGYYCGTASCMNVADNHKDWPLFAFKKCRRTNPDGYRETLFPLKYHSYPDNGYVDALDASNNIWYRCNHNDPAENKQFLSCFDCIKKPT